MAFLLHIVFRTKMVKPNQWKYGIFLWIYFFHNLVLPVMHFPIIIMLFTKIIMHLVNITIQRKMAWSAKLSVYQFSLYNYDKRCLVEIFSHCRTLRQQRSFVISHFSRDLPSFTCWLLSCKKTRFVSLPSKSEVEFATSRMEQGQGTIKKH